MDRSYQNQT